jgi:hypothetical protein
MTEHYAHLRPELFTQADLATIIDLRQAVQDSVNWPQNGHGPRALPTPWKKKMVEPPCKPSVSPVVASPAGWTFL